MAEIILIGAAAGIANMGISGKLARSGDLGSGDLGISSKMAEISLIGAAAGIDQLGTITYLARSGGLGTDRMGISMTVAEMFDRMTHSKLCHRRRVVIFNVV